MNHEAHKEIARRALLIQALPERHVETILSKAVWQRFDRGETIFLQGDSAQVIHIVVAGWVKLYRMTPGGKEAVVSVFTRGESFGEAVALRALPYPVSAEAVTASDIMCIPSSTLVDLIRGDSEVGLTILSSTFGHLHQLVQQLEMLKSRNGAQRIAEFLLSLCDCETGQCTVRLPYDKVLIAGRLGMTPESLSRSFSKLRQAGVIVERDRARIGDIDALRSYAEADD
ncbi:Crp/Fnr family transcriptional regulator [Shimia abyssi]|uniref:CRP-like cAMP-binding protein n=1 Tax=Shimia abyssi TaxID=1662395 RepID=A0A2P8F966_9RHOB|nr:Crp/Fnr family transcriptional regulator [Shimia abyssi]PSL18276.1 CRP-like cAMP-binding protein [Shimia abyssi]